MWSATLLEIVARVPSLYDPGIVFTHTFMPSFLFIVTIMISYCRYFTFMHIIFLLTFIYVTDYCNLIIKASTGEPHIYLLCISNFGFIHIFFWWS